jgi:tetratricopeptide (TPR) repeat protein
MLEASALNYQGYLDRQQGRYMQAVGHYQASAMLQRRLALADLSSVLINLSYAMVLTGDFRHARLLTEEAEAWSRRGGGNSLALARALNARALVEVYDSHPRTALRYSGRALGIVAGFHAPRLLGLIYHTRARAHRYRIVSVTEEQGRLAPGAFDEALEEVSQVLGAFDEALKEANQAVNLLKNYPADRVAALIERGCMYREIARVYRLTGETVATVAAVDSSEADMRRAAILAGAMDLPDQAALAWINLAWLWYHVGQIEPAFEAMAEARSLIPAEYAFPEPLPEGRHEGERWPPIAEGTRKDEARLPFWNILGKAEMLASYAALDGARVAKGAKKQGEYLRDAVRHATLSLAYDELVSDAHFELVRAEGSLHRRILDDEVSIGDLHRYADEAAHQHGLHQPTRFQEFLARMFGPASLWA